MELYDKLLYLFISDWSSSVWHSLWTRGNEGSNPSSDTVLQNKLGDYYARKIKTTKSSLE